MENINENFISNLKKSISNSVNYVINKKLKSINFDDHLNSLDSLSSLNKTLINYSKNNLDNNLKKVSKIESDIGDLNNKISNIENKINNIEISNKKIIDILNLLNDKIESTNKNDKIIINEKQNEKESNFNENESFNTFYKELKVQDFNFDNDFIKNCLHNHNIKFDLNIFKEMYIKNCKKEYYPIKFYKKNFQYWKNNTMIFDDENASYIKDTITQNIINCYLKVNTFENYINDSELFIKNQEYILKISSSKYKDKILKEIEKIINQ